MGGGQLFDLRLARYVHALRGPGSVRLVCPASSELAGRAGAASIPVTPMEFPPPAALPLIAAQAVALRRALRGRDALVVAGTARCQAVAVVAGLGARLVHLMTERDSADRASVRLVQRHTGRVVALGAQAAAAYGSAALCNFLLDEEFERLAAVPASAVQRLAGRPGAPHPREGRARAHRASWRAWTAGGGWSSPGRPRTRPMPRASVPPPPRVCSSWARSTTPPI